MGKINNITSYPYMHDYETSVAIILIQLVISYHKNILQAVSGVWLWVTKCDLLPLNKQVVKCVYPV